MHDYPRNIRATDPANAMLNYTYRIAEAEAVHACHALGLDPAMGILHADKQGSDSFALDLIEAVRPYCDRVILQFLNCGLGIPVNDRGKPAYLNRLWFDETRDGQCQHPERTEAGTDTGTRADHVLPSGPVAAMGDQR
jgi:hypothetical protein